MKRKATESSANLWLFICIKSSPESLRQMRAHINRLVREHPALHDLKGLSFAPFSHPKPELQA